LHAGSASLCRLEPCGARSLGTQNVALELHTLALSRARLGDTRSGTLVQRLQLLAGRAAFLWGASGHSITQTDAFNVFLCCLALFTEPGSLLLVALRRLL
jgi:hypothetical protein